MAVYVDNYGAAFGRMIMSHMIADSHEELLEIARKIGVQEKWIQYEGTYREHFDICLSKRKKAVLLGAIEMSPIELVKKMYSRRGKV
jgi:hypothetical protein